MKSLFGSVRSSSSNITLQLSWVSSDIRLSVKVIRRRWSGVTILNVTEMWVGVMIAGAAPAPRGLLGARGAAARGAVALGFDLAMLVLLIPHDCVRLGA